MVEFYINQIVYKGMDIERVPAKWRQAVREELVNREQESIREVEENT